jgi:predicted  nucleic acid-binding Zn-ribbon protein
MANISDLDKRISVLETEFENMEKTVMKVESVVHDNYEGTIAIKERLDKWNGSIPHLAEDVKEMKSTQTELVRLLSEKAISDTKQAIKINIMWAVGAAIIGAAFSYAIKSLVG